MSPIRRICLHSGPGAGKSTTAARVFGELKALGHNVEFVPEYIKTWAVEGKHPRSWDQLYILAKQVYAEERLLRNGVQVVVCESALLTNCTYAKYYGNPGWEEMVRLALQFEEMYPGLHLFLARDGVPYVDAARYQNLEQARKVDELVLEMVQRVPHQVVPTVEFPSIMEIIKKGIE